MSCFPASRKLLRSSHEKWIKNHTETVYVEVLLAKVVAGEMSKDAMVFFNFVLETK